MSRLGTASVPLIRGRWPFRSKSSSPVSEVWPIEPCNDFTDTLPGSKRRLPASAVAPTAGRVVCNSRSISTASGVPRPNVIAPLQPPGAWTTLPDACAAEPRNDSDTSTGQSWPPASSVSSAPLVIASS